MAPYTRGFKLKSLTALRRKASELGGKIASAGINWIQQLQLYQNGIHIRQYFQLPIHIYCLLTLKLCCEIVLLLGIRAWKFMMATRGVCWRPLIYTIIMRLFEHHVILLSCTSCIIMRICYPRRHTYSYIFQLLYHM